MDMNRTWDKHLFFLAMHGRKAHILLTKYERIKNLSHSFSSKETPGGFATFCSCFNASQK